MLIWKAYLWKMTGRTSAEQSKFMWRRNTFPRFKNVSGFHCREEKSNQMEIYLYLSEFGFYNRPIRNIIQLLTGDKGNIWYVGPEDKMLAEAEGRGPRALFCLKVQHIICCPNLQSITVLLYLHWFRIKYSTQTIHKQSDHDQTGLNLDELILDELALVLINSTPSQMSTSPRFPTTNWHNLGRISFGQIWLRTNPLACDVKCVIAVQHLFFYAQGPTSIFIYPLLRTLSIGITLSETNKGINIYYKNVMCFCWLWFCTFNFLPSDAFAWFKQPFGALQLRFFFLFSLYFVNRRSFSFSINNIDEYPGLPNSNPWGVLCSPSTFIRMLTLCNCEIVTRRTIWNNLFANFKNVKYFNFDNICTMAYDTLNEKY